jgi:hypothetical protein
MKKPAKKKNRKIHSLRVPFGSTTSIDYHKQFHHGQIDPLPDVLRCHVGDIIKT